MCELTQSLERVSGSFFSTASTSRATPRERLTAEEPTDVYKSLASRNQKQQRRTEQELNAIHGWIWREFSEERGVKADRDLIGLRSLRHNAAQRLLEVKQLDLPQIAGLLTTSEDMLRKTNSDHHRFPSNEIIREVFG